MATTKTNNKESKNMSNNSNNETRVICPVCGTEFAIGDHEHKVKNGVAIGKDSGLGDIYLPVSKRGDILKAAGVDPSKYFAIKLPTGGEQLMKMDESGRAVPVDKDDPVLSAIAKQGTVPNRKLFRRWVMSQVFHWLATDEECGNGKWLTWHGCDYPWKMLIEELRVQAKLYSRDIHAFRARNRWFNRELAVVMVEDYIDKLRKDANSRKLHKCKGVPYIKIGYRDVFYTDIERKVIDPFKEHLADIRLAKTPADLYAKVEQFYRDIRLYGSYSPCSAWKDAYKGMGAYATMENLLRFHGCTFPIGNIFYDKRKEGLEMLVNAAASYAKGEGWRLWGLMKQMIAENGIDIRAKMHEWRMAKEAKVNHNRR